MTDVGAVFEAAASQGIRTLVLHGSVPDTLPYGPAATNLIHDAVASGDVVIVPAAPVKLGDRERVGWWRIDPQTGVTTDVMDDGAGQSMGEYVVIVDEELGAILCEGAMARTVALAIIPPHRWSGPMAARHSTGCTRTGSRASPAARDGCGARAVSRWRGGHDNGAS